MRKVTLMALMAAALAGGVAYAYLVPVPRAEGRERCLVEPRPPAELLALVGAPTELLRIPVSSPRPHPWPAAHVPTVDDETFRALFALMREAVACAENGDAARLYALYTEDFLRRTADAAATAGSRGGLPAVPVWRGSWLVDEGRVGMMFSEPQSTQTPDRGNPIYFVFVKVGDHWLIDDAVPVAD